ncbi:unnamed protein product, partial [Meganyctiphanes norvegica]
TATRDTSSHIRGNTYIIMMLRRSLLMVVLAAVAWASPVSETEHEESSKIVSNTEVEALDQKSTDREGKLLPSLFPLVQIVTFENAPCKRDDGGSGVCYSQSECEQLGGDVSGTCAKGFGVCCSLHVTSSTIITNGTYFVNPGYPGSYSNPGMRMVEIKPPAGTCQILLNFDMFSIAPPVDGDCSNDTFVVSGANSGLDIPVLCGENGGQHMYIDIDSSEDPIKLIVTTSALNFARTWKIGVIFIGENDPCKAPNRCLQYHKETTGKFMSFNYGAGSIPQLLNDYCYSICFGYVQNYCDIGLNFDRFDFGNINGNCGDDFLGVNHDKFCGDFNELSIQANATGPISLLVCSDVDNSNQEEGFSGDYTMMGC